MGGLMGGADQQPGLNPPGLFAGLSQEKMSDVWRRYGRVLWNRRRLILGVFVLVFIGFGVKAYRTPPVYTATGTIAIEPAQQQVIIGEFTPGKQDNYQGQLIQLQLDILQSRLLAERVINKLNLGNNPAFVIPAAATLEEREGQRTQMIDAFLSQLSVEPPSPSSQGVIRVHYTSTNPRLAAEVLNALFENFIEYNRESNTQAVESAADWLTEQLGAIEDKLQKSKEELLKYQQSTDLLYMGEAESNPVIEQFSELKGQLAEAELARLSAEILYQRARQGGLKALPASAKGSGLTGLEEERRKLEAQLAELRTIYQEGAPPLKKVEQQLANLKAQIERAEQEQRDAILENLKNEFEVAQERARAAAEAVEKQRAEILKQNRDALQFSLLKREAEVDEKLFQVLSERLREAGLMRSLAPKSNIRVIDRAEIPLAPSSSNTATLIRGAIVALILAIGLALLLDFLDDSIKTVEDVETLLRMPNLGLIPLLNSEGERSLLRRKRTPERSPILLTTSDNGSPGFTEAYRTLRTSVLLSSATRPPRTIVITSNEAGAGKTTTALNTAIVLAQAGKRVLLIDGDMRHPGCAKAVGLDNTVGLSTHLSSDGAPPTVYHDCVVAGLDVLPAGPIPPNPSELLSSEKARALIESVATQYDHVVIDTPPLGLVSDALILSALVDGVILIVKAEKNSRRGILRVKESLRNVNARVLGVLLNAVDFQRHSGGYYGYGYGYGYGYYYYQNEKSEKERRGGRGKRGVEE